MENCIRVRFAPSPTGYLHVGGARTALFNWLFALRQNGIFILRIEDTDADRSKPEMTTAILDSLNWLGITWNEGPYYQSDRLQLYREMAAKLEKLGHAYPCFCTPEELRAKRARAEAEHRAWKYDGACRNMTEADREQRRAEGRKHALRFRVPQEGGTAFEDLVFGSLELANSEIEDFVLLRSDGQPTYHLSVVADDLEMKITHVIRGADHLSNTPKQILMCRALGAALPRFAHLPLILGPDRSRLSKRHGATSVGAYRDQGILPEALMNFLALLGWTPAGGKEIIAPGEMIAKFDLSAVSKSNAVFDPEKLAWMNAEYLRHMPLEKLMPRVRAQLAAENLDADAFYEGDGARAARAVELLQTRARTLNDFSQSGRALFSDDYEYEAEARKKFWKDAELPGLIEALAAMLDSNEAWDAASCEKVLRDLAEQRGVKAGLLINAARVALTGQGVAPSLFDMMEVMGRARVTERLQRAAQVMRGSAAS